MSLEEIRKEASKQSEYNKKIGYSLLICVLLTILFFLISIALGIIFVIVDIVLFIIFMTKISAGKMDLKKELFNNFILPKLEESFDKFKYDQGEIDKNIIRRLKLIDSGDKITTSNMIEGIYRNVSFVGCGLRCSERVEDEQGNTSYDPTFEGKLFIIGGSILKNEGYVDIIDCRHCYSLNYTERSKATLNHPIETEFDIFVSHSNLSLPKSFLDEIYNLKQMYKYALFNIRVCKDRIYMFVDKVATSSYFFYGNLKEVSEEDIDLIVKKDSCFFTNIISCIVDSKGDN